ncbi:hypothetical protein PUNSTDRAFT_47751 [Punctularia strigosozonata HHB-11173 SS5]|uniref:Uncharacterized protein n=1 Tax=Punctularia strigosozonata (strain HHB-11173) TaxID=741275 RepID=R7S146_PUNST|nr:uncharacterized protein PUNSTDRAFT_47751 [Punctularia strigosozonata HHB-11173 SS5]EIN03943.1 hypothetical protein PUNSTDRAFT_47751 [Punctularia strigosozonata HHB-11173 SS5]
MDLIDTNPGKIRYSDQYSMPIIEPGSIQEVKMNMQLAQRQLQSVQELARRAIAGIENAYRPGTSAAQTTADLASLKDTLRVLLDFLKQTGVGDLPLLPANVQPPQEQQMQELEAATKKLFERQKRLQDSAAVVVNIMNSQVQGASQGGEPSHSQHSQRR